MLRGWREKAAGKTDGEGEQWRGVWRDGMGVPG